MLPLSFCSAAEPTEPNQPAASLREANTRDLTEKSRAVRKI
jgi:hypothetical protein